MENFNLGAGMSFIEYTLMTPDGLSFKLKVFNKNNSGRTELVLKQGMTTEHFFTTLLSKDECQTYKRTFNKVIDDIDVANEILKLNALKIIDVKKTIGHTSIGNFSDLVITYIKKQ